MSIESSLTQLCTAVVGAGKDILDVLLLLQKLFIKIKDNPHENKYRSLRLDNPRLQHELFCFSSAKDFLLLAGFEESNGSLSFHGKSAVQFNDAFRAVLRRFSTASQERMSMGKAPTTGNSSESTSEGNSAEHTPACDLDLEMESFHVESFHVERYHEALKGSAMGAGRVEAYALRTQHSGVEALQTLEMVFCNLHQHPNNDKYKSLNMDGKAGMKLLPAVPLMNLAGFQIETKTDGRTLAEISSVNMHRIGRITAMVRLVLDSEAAAICLPEGFGVQGHSLGAALGVAVGDAMGAALEKPRTTPKTAVEVDKALEMSGDSWVAPGQVTDDTEMAISLADALVSSTTSVYPIDAVADKYCEWALSSPFDIGFTTEKAFRSRDSKAADCRQRALASANSQANGALMRCAPLAVWAIGRGVSIQQLAEDARADASLSHPNYTIGHVNASYVIAIATLLTNEGDRSAALGAAKSYLEEQRQLVAPGAEEASAWFELALSDADLPFAGAKGGGWAKIAFTHAFRHLKLGLCFEEAMRVTLTAGGDTDTNAAIVGGLVGAAVGIQGIPEHALRAVLSCDTRKGCHRRPSQYHPSRFPGLIKHLLGQVGS